LRCRSLVDLYSAALQADGIPMPKTDNEMIRAAHSTSSVPHILADVSEKVALEQFQNAPSAWPKICRRVPVRNFKTAHLVRLLLAGQFEQVAGDGSLKHASASDSDYSVRADTFGRMFGLSRKDIIDDDAGLFMDTATIIGRKGAGYISRLFTKTLLANLGNFFSSGNGNYAEGAQTALAVGSLVVALAAIRGRKDADGENVDVVGTTLLVPPTLETTAKAILKSQELMRYVSETVDNAPRGNPLQDVLQLAVEPRLENTTYAGSSNKAWYVFSAPGDGAMVAAFLNGREFPTVEQDDSPFDKLGIQFRGYIDVGMSLADPLAAYKAKGEA
jgi:hypothetical protein